jgi:hypothetical protein
MTGPAKQKHAAAKSALRKLRLIGSYHATAFLAKVFEKPFWFFEQWRGRIMDRIDGGSDT